MRIVKLVLGSVTAPLFFFNLFQSAQMKKIRTIFKRKEDGNLIDEWITDPYPSLKKDVFDKDILTATEKLDGTNVQLTIRNETVVTLDKRRNPTKAQKQSGIIDPWYVDADQDDPDNKHIWEAVSNTDLTDIEDGEWSGEAIGPKIQGNPLDLDKPEVYLFSDPDRRELITFFEKPPLEFNALREWLFAQKSHLNPEKPIEGLVWWVGDQAKFKIKLKDFKE